jgi:uncharacterized protein YutE (UPF0331/DUF86 family)
VPEKWTLSTNLPPATPTLHVSLKILTEQAKISAIQGRLKDNQQIPLAQSRKVLSPGKIGRRITADRLAWIDRMLTEIRDIPLKSIGAFLGDSRNLFTAESCLRTFLEALFDLGRHILAKCFGIGVTECKQIASELERQGVLDSEHALLLRVLAGYPNRMVHFYHEITSKALYEICTNEIKHVRKAQEALLNWVQAHQEYMDETL